jgi:peptidoglycan/LPS O-acetylase OafA/YrhL
LYGVQLFYIVSAITLCMSWNVRSAHEAAPVRNFFLRRFFRIAPMFYLAIALYVGMYGFSPRSWAPNGIEWWFIPLTLLFLHGFHPETITSVVPGGWSIAVEMNFYLLLPFLLRRLVSTRSYVVFITACFAAYAVSAVAFEHLWSAAYPADQHYLVSAFIYLNFFSQLPVFALGILAYRALDDRLGVHRWVIGGALGLLAIILLSQFLPESTRTTLVPSHVTMGCVFALLALTLARFPWRPLVNPVVIQLGKISFSMYLLHFAVIELCSRLGLVGFFPTGDVSSILFYLCVVATTASLSCLTYRWIERRGVAFGNRLIASLEPRGREEAPDTMRPLPLHVQ